MEAWIIVITKIDNVRRRMLGEVLFKRVGGVSGGFPARASVSPISSGFSVAVVKRGVGSVDCVSVAYRLCPVASEYGQASQGPKSMFLRMLQQSRRASAAVEFERMRQRLAGQVERQSGTSGFSLSQLRSRQSGSCPLRQRLLCLRPVMSVAFLSGVPVAWSRSASPLQPEIGESLSEMSKVASVAFRASAQSAPSVDSQVPVASRETVQSRPSLSRESPVASDQSSLSSVALASVAPVGSVQSRAVEWIQAGDALRSVLGRVRAVAEASAAMESVTREDKGRMH